MQAKDTDEALQAMAEGGKTRSTKSSKLTKGKPAGELGTAIEQRHKKAGSLGKAQAMQDLAAMGQSYSETLAAGMTAFQGVAENALDGLISSDFETADLDGEGFDFLGECLTEALKLS
jgi:hypothetical protein